MITHNVIYFYISYELIQIGPYESIGFKLFSAQVNWFLITDNLVIFANTLLYINIFIINHFPHSIYLLCIFTRDNMMFQLWLQLLNIQTCIL
jgi:hypothetical protein